VETRAQHVLLHTGLELHAVAPSWDGSEKKIYYTVTWSPCHYWVGARHSAITAGQCIIKHVIII